MNKPFEKYETYPIIWQNIQIEIRYCDYVAKVDEQTTIVHLEVESQTRERLPITETGYKSYFTANALLKNLADPLNMQKYGLMAKPRIISLGKIMFPNHVNCPSFKGRLESVL